MSRISYPRPRKFQGSGNGVGNYVEGTQFSLQRSGQRESRTAGVKNDRVSFMNIIQGELRNRIFRWRLNLEFLQKRDIKPASMRIDCPAISSLEQALLLKLGEILSNRYLADGEALGQIVDLDIPFVLKELKNSSMPCPSGHFTGISIGFPPCSWRDNVAS